MLPLKLFLFGPPRLERDGDPVDISLRKALALLVYLAVTSQSHSRDTLATLFWPDDSQSKARGNLRRALSRINIALGKGQLETDREHAGFSPKADLKLDVDYFQHCLAECQSHDHPSNEVCTDCLPLLTKAVSSYNDDFLAGFSLPDCPDFDEWQFFQSESLRQALASALERLVHGHSAQGEYELAIPHARRWLAMDPLHEPAHQQLMELYAQNNQQAAAVRQYQECVRILNEELGVSPSQETTALYEAIKKKRTSPQPSRAEKKSSPHNIPPQPTPFIGRETELAALDNLITDADVRLVTIVGPGGIGKTRLAIQAGTESLDAFVDGICFVPLAPINSDEFLVTAIAEALGISFYGTIDPKEQLLKHLRNKESLLILDNFEHVLEGAILLSELVLAAPGLKLLITSREHLNLREEWIYDLQGLTFPATTDSPPSREGLGEGEPPVKKRRDLAQTALPTGEDSTPTPVLPFGGGGSDYSALQLFEQRARQMQADFDLASEYPDVVRICQLVDGMPLGIELAAAWVRLMSCQVIAQEIQKGIDFLTTTLRNVPDRHRSLRAVFDHSWHLLSDEEQDVLKKLSVFRGGFLSEAAEQVAGAALPLLSALVDKSLLHRTQSGRYEIHTLLRQYATEKLQEDAEAYEVTQKVHAHYYADFMQQCEKGMRGHRQLETYAKIAADIDNIRTSWRWAVEKKDLEIFEKSQDTLTFFYEEQGQFQEGEAALRRAATALRGPGTVMAEPLTERQATVMGTLLDNQAWFTRRLGLPEAKELWRQSIAVLRQAGASGRWELAGALSLLGTHICFCEDYAQADLLLQESLAVATEVGDTFLLGIVRESLGQTAQWQGEYRAAIPHLQQSLNYFEQVSERRYRAFTLNNWGRAICGMGQYAQAEELLTESLEIRRVLGDQIGVAFSLLDQGKLAGAQGYIAEAKQQIEASLAICEEIGERMVIALCLNSLGVMARLQCEFERSEELLHKSLALFKEIEYISMLPLCLNNLAHLSYDQGAYQQAEAYLQESLAICEETSHSGEMASALRYLGYIATGCNKYSEARQYFWQALEIVKRTGGAPVALDVFVGCGALLMADKPTDAERERAVELLALVQHHPASEYETKEKARRLLVEWTMTLQLEVAEAAQAQGQALDLWETATELLEEV